MSGCAKTFLENLKSKSLSVSLNNKLKSESDAKLSLVAGVETARPLRHSKWPLSILHNFSTTSTVNGFLMVRLLVTLDNISFHCKAAEEDRVWTTASAMQSTRPAPCQCLQARGGKREQPAAAQPS
eukprot:g73840.t1